MSWWHGLPARRLSKEKRWRMSLSDGTKKPGWEKKVRFPRDREAGNIWSLGWSSLTLISDYSGNKNTQSVCLTRIQINSTSHGLILGIWAKENKHQEIRHLVTLTRSPDISSSFFMTCCDLTFLYFISSSYLRIYHVCGPRTKASANIFHQI